MLKKSLVLGLLALISLGTAAAWQLAKVEMDGSYVWNVSPRDPGNLRAEFTPNGDNQWNVSFYFRFNGQNHVYTGTASGNLENGPLTGEVANESKRRNWTFEGNCSNGKFTGTHTEIYRDGGTKRTGTLELAVKK
jgi:hypothetical protein